MEDPAFHAAFELDERDDIGFVHAVRPIVAGVLGLVAAVDVYVIKIDTWFGSNWLGFSNKVLGTLGIASRRSLRVPPFVPSRVQSQRYLRREPSGRYHLGPAVAPLHLEQPSEANRRRLVSTVCPTAALIWWSGSTRANQRGCVMAYLPSPEGHVGWYAEVRNASGWSVGATAGTTAQELSTYAAGAGAGAGAAAAAAAAAAS